MACNLCISICAPKLRNRQWQCSLFCSLFCSALLCSALLCAVLFCSLLFVVCVLFYLFSVSLLCSVMLCMHAWIGVGLRQKRFRPSLDRPCQARQNSELSHLRGQLPLRNWVSWSLRPFQVSVLCMAWLISTNCLI